MFITTQPCELNAVRGLLNLMITAVSSSSDFIMGKNAIGVFMSAAPATRHCEQYVLSLPTPKSPPKRKMSISKWLCYIPMQKNISR